MSLQLRFFMRCDSSMIRYFQLYLDKCCLSLMISSLLVDRQR